MTQAFAPTRTAALERLTEFLPRVKDYAARRNYDFGPGNHTAVSTLSPYIRHRLVTEDEVLQAALGRHSLKSIEKFVQEVYWRTYWKGWLEMRPSVWGSYRAGLTRALDQVQTQSGLRGEWEAACKGETGIEAFDSWARELVQTGYMHNHARMWFASIWIFTLRLPWELGADFFLRHLLDGDPASNTLSWRWVAGLQTAGKNYVATASNISKFTEGRLKPLYQLASNPAPLEGPPPPPRMDPPMGDRFDPSEPHVLVLHDDDLNPGYLFDQGLKPQATIFLHSADRLSPLALAPQVTAFKRAAMEDCAARWAARLGAVSHASSATELSELAQGCTVVAPYAPVGPNAETLAQVRGVAVKRVMRSCDAECWPYATAGFFKFKDKIPKFVGSLRGLSVA